MGTKDSSARLTEINDTELSEVMGGMIGIIRWHEIQRIQREQAEREAEQLINSILGVDNLI